MAVEDLDTNLQTALTQLAKVAPTWSHAAQQGLAGELIQLMDERKQFTAQSHSLPIPPEIATEGDRVRLGQTKSQSLPGPT